MTSARVEETEPRTSVLFVCLGNICRSPLAEGVFGALLERRGTRDRFVIESAGTGSWHVGEPPDPRMAEVARDHRIELSSRARQVTRADLDSFDWVIAMDRSNLRSLSSMSGGGARARLHRLREFDPEPGDGDVPDPYYGGPEGFLDVYAIVERSCRALLDRIEAEPH